MKKSQPSQKMQRLQAGKGTDITLLEFLSQQLNISKSTAKKLLDARLVFVNHKRTWIAGSGVFEGDVIEVAQQEAPITLTKKHLLYEDEHLLVINKPQGFLTNGPKSAETIMRTLFDNKEILAIHRLDKETSGCVLFGKNLSIKERMEEVFRNHEIEKRYLALAHGQMKPSLKKISIPLDGKEALTFVELLSYKKEASYVQLTIVTGRMHQIRRHLAQVGHPVIGDKEYSKGIAIPTTFKSISRQLLHAAEISFLHPWKEKPLTVRAPLPSDFLSVLQKLHLNA